jgi:conjugal transfer mating pair stabilization protein TraN
MKIPACVLLMVFAGAAHADATSDAYNAGASYGKSNASQGTGTLKNPSAVTGSIPGYTSDPPEKSYYGGVQGGDGGLSDKGQTALGNSSAAQTVIDSGTKNPVPTIDPNAPYITIGKLQSTADQNALDGIDRNMQYLQQQVSTTISTSFQSNYQWGTGND